MGNLGWPEILLIALVVLLLFGAKRIPEIAGSMGKGIREFKRNINDATREVTDTRAPQDEPRLPPAGEAGVEARRDAELKEPKRLL